MDYSLSAFLPSLIFRCQDFSDTGMDSYYLNTMRQGFRDIGVNREIFLVITPLILACVLGLWLAKRLNKRRLQRRRYKGGVLTNKTHIRELLEQAANARSKFVMSFSSSKDKRKSAACTLVDLDSKRIILEPPGTITPGQGWVGRKANCLFSVPLDKSGEQRSFFTFESTITAVGHKDGFSNVTIETPGSISTSQQRDFLRIAPPSKYVQELHVWPGTKEGAKALLHHVNEGANENAKGPRFRLANISGGGVGLEAAFNSADEKKRYDLEKGKDMLIHLSLIDPERGGVRDHYLLGRIRYLAGGIKDTELGLVFRAVGRPDQESLSGMSWRQITEGGVKEIEHWVVKRHLEMFRVGVR